MLGQQTIGREIVERGNEQALGQVSGGTEDDEGADISRAGPLLPRNRRRRRDVHHDPGAFGSTCPPKPLRIADSIRSAKLRSSRERKRA